MNNLISIGKASEMLGISKQTLRKWEVKGEIACTRDFAGRRLFNQNDIDSHLNKTHPQGQPSLELFPDSIVTLKELTYGQKGRLIDFAKSFGVGGAAQVVKLSYQSRLSNLKRKLDILGYKLNLVFFVDGEMEVLIDGENTSETLRKILHDVSKKKGYSAYEKLLTFDLTLNTLVKHLKESDPEGGVTFLVGAISKEDGKRWILALDNDDVILP